MGFSGQEEMERGIILLKMDFLERHLHEILQNVKIIKALEYHISGARSLDKEDSGFCLFLLTAVFSAPSAVPGS